MHLIIPRTGGQFSSFWGIVLIDEMADYYAIRKHGNRKKQNTATGKNNSTNL
jgi:hypothetical protein